MSQKVEVKDDVMYYKSMRLKSNNLVITVKEKSEIARETGRIEIYHSPAKWEGDRFMVILKNRAELKDYIAMLQDFDERFGDALDLIQAPGPIGAKE